MGLSLKEGRGIEVVPPHFECYYRRYVAGSLGLHYRCARRNAIDATAARSRPLSYAKLAYLRAAARARPKARGRVDGGGGGSDAPASSQRQRDGDRRDRRCGPGCQLATALPLPVRQGIESAGYRDAPTRVNLDALRGEARILYQQSRGCNLCRLRA